MDDKNNLEFVPGLVSILIVSMREEKTIGKCLETLVKDYSKELEILVSIPDNPTYQALIETAKKYNLSDKIRRSEISAKGQAVGKPSELNELIKMARGEYWIFTDGDTFFGDNPINKILKPLKSGQFDAVSARPRSADQKSNFFGYVGNLLADAAHTRRMELLAKKDNFFPFSGYFFASKPFKYEIPANCLSDDAFLAYKMLEDGKKIGYVPEAEVFVYYPKNLKDFFKQKKRSAGGFIQLKQFGVLKKNSQTRSFWLELKWFMFPLRYAKGLHELCWSLMLYPVRLWLWIKIFWEQKIVKKSFQQTWERVESTKIN